MLNKLGWLVLVILLLPFSLVAVAGWLMSHTKGRIIMIDCSKVKASIVTAYLLIQNGKIVDVCSDPGKLNFGNINTNWDFQVYAGCRNEWGQNEIAGVVARVWVAHTYSKYIIKTVAKDFSTKETLVALTMPTEVIRRRLEQMFEQQYITDPCQLGQICLFAL